MNLGIVDNIEPCTTWSVRFLILDTKSEWVSSVGLFPRVTAPCAWECQTRIQTDVSKVCLINLTFSLNLIDVIYCNYCIIILILIVAENMLNEQSRTYDKAVLLQFGGWARGLTTPIVIRRVLKICTSPQTWTCAGSINWGEFLTTVKFLNNEITPWSCLKLIFVQTVIIFCWFKLFEVFMCYLERHVDVKRFVNVSLSTANHTRALSDIIPGMFVISRYRMF